MRRVTAEITSRAPARVDADARTARVTRPGDDHADGSAAEVRRFRRAIHAVARHPFVVVCLAVAVLAALSLWSYWSERRGFPLQIDEAGYAALGLALAQALSHHGVGGLVHSFETQQTVFGPLVPLLTVPLHAVAGQRVGNGFVVLQGFYAVLVLATYGIARRLTSAWLAALAAVVVATTPAVTLAARGFYFAVPAAALVATAIWCFLRADGASRIGWALAGGAVLGLALLARTHVLAVAPIVYGGAGLQVVGRGTDARRRLLHLAGAAIVTTGVAATWYARNAGDAVGFLLGTRYRAATSSQDKLQLAPLLRFLAQGVTTPQLPVTIVLLGVVALGVRAWRRRGRAAPATPRRPWMARVRFDDGFFLTVVVVGLVIVFAAGEFASGLFPYGEWLIVLPVVVAGAVAAIAPLEPRVRVAAAWTLVGLCVVNTAMMSGAVADLATVRTVDAGPFGPLTLTDGRQFVQVAFNHFEPVDSGRVPFPLGAPGHLPSRLRAVLPIQREAAAWLVRYAARHGQEAVAFAVGADSRLLNINDLSLQDRLADPTGGLITGRVELPVTASVQRYCAQVDDPHLGLPNFLLFYRSVTAAGRLNGRSPGVTRATRLGFAPVRTWRVPDGTVTAYWRSQGAVPPRCPS